MLEIQLEELDTALTCTQNSKEFWKLLAFLIENSKGVSFESLV